MALLVTIDEDAKTALAEAFRDGMAAQFASVIAQYDASDDLDSSILKADWLKLGMAMAEMLEPICQHIIDNAEVDGVPDLVT